VPESEPPEEASAATTEKWDAETNALIKRWTDANLSEKEQRLFSQGHRLSPFDRQRLLNELDDAQIEERGLRWPDEPPELQQQPKPSAELEAAREEANRLHVAFRGKPNVPLILLLLWDFACPLWLDCCVQTILHGSNASCSLTLGPEKPPEPLPANWVDESDAKQLADFLASIEKAQKRGNTTRFLQKRPFSSNHFIALGAVPKGSEGDFRLVADHSERKSATSVNALSDGVRIKWQAWETHRANAEGAQGGLTTEWDISNAYPWLPKRELDQHLSVNFVKGHGFLVNLRGEFGNKHDGFAWNIFGERLLLTLYHVASFCTKVGEEPSDIKLVPPPRNPFAKNATLTKPPDGYAVAYKGDKYLTRAAILAFSSKSWKGKTNPDNPGSVNLTRVDHWVDDFQSKVMDHAQARRNDRAVLFLHSLLRMPLSREKFSPASSRGKHRGIIVDLSSAPPSFSMPIEKTEKLINQLQSVANSKASQRFSLHFLWSLQGLIVYHATAVYPLARQFTRPFNEAVRAAQSALRAKPALNKNSATTVFPAAARAAVHFWIELARRGPSCVSTALKPPQALLSQNASAVAHTDWAGAGDRVACFVISQGWFARGEMPPRFYEPKNPAALAKSSPVGEAAAILAMLHTAGDRLDNHVLVCATDSDVVVKRWNKTAKAKQGSSEALDKRLREITLFCVAHNIALITTFVFSKQNRSDVLTRCADAQEFFKRNEDLNLPSKPFELDLVWPTTSVGSPPARSSCARTWQHPPRDPTARERSSTSKSVRFTEFLPPGHRQQIPSCSSSSSPQNSTANPTTRSRARSRRSGTLPQ
jgi:hypothetical protein